MSAVKSCGNVSGSGHSGCCTEMIETFLQDVDWGELDYIIVDTPPGTSDEHLSTVNLLSSANVSGAVILTTPQVCLFVLSGVAVGCWQSFDVPLATASAEAYEA